MGWVGYYRDPGEAGLPPRGKCCQSYLSKVLTLVSTLVNNQGLVAVPPQPHQSIKQVPVNSYIPVVQVSCYVFSFGANKRGSPHKSTPVCCLLGLRQLKFKLFDFGVATAFILVFSLPSKKFESKFLPPANEVAGR